MKKIALVVYNVNDFGGAERRLFRVYNELAKTHECDIIVRGSSDEQAFIRRIEKADCDLSNINRIICIDNNLKCLFYLLNYRKYDIIHYFDSCGFNAAISLLGSLLKFKTICTLASVHDVKRIYENRMTIKERILLKESTVIDVLYPWGLDSIRKLRNNAYLTVGTFTDLKKFRPSSKEKLMVYAAARLEKLKNPELLVEACNECKSALRSYGYRVVILGQGELEQELRKKIHDYRIDDILELHGYKKTSDYFPTAEAVFSLQTIENYPSQVIAEACASGCYLFVTDVGCSRKCAESEFASFVGANSNDLASAIESYLAFDNHRKSRIRDLARSFAERNYSISASIDYYLTLIENA